MDKYYGNVCELDIIFNFQKAYFILDELLLAGELQESSKKNVLRCISQQDSLEDMEVSDIFPLPLNSSPLPLPLPLPLPFDALSSHYTLFYSTPGSNGLILPRSRKMWSPRSCSGSLFAFVASILINTTVVHMSGYRRNVSQSWASWLIVSLPLPLLLFIYPHPLPVFIISSLTVAVPWIASSWSHRVRSLASPTRDSPLSGRNFPTFDWFLPSQRLLLILLLLIHSLQLLHPLPCWYILGDFIFELLPSPPFFPSFPFCLRLSPIGGSISVSGATTSRHLYHHPDLVLSRFSTITLNSRDQDWLPLHWKPLVYFKMKVSRWYFSPGRDGDRPIYPPPRPQPQPQP